MFRGAFVSGTPLRPWQTVQLGGRPAPASDGLLRGQLVRVLGTVGCWCAQAFWFAFDGLIRKDNRGAPANPKRHQQHQL